MLRFSQSFKNYFFPRLTVFVDVDTNDYGYDYDYDKTTYDITAATKNIHNKIRKYGISDNILSQGSCCSISFGHETFFFVAGIFIARRDFVVVEFCSMGFFVEEVSRGGLGH